MFFISHLTYALSFYGSKMILYRPIILDGSNSFCLGSNHFGQVQIIKNYNNLNLTKMIWTQPKQFGWFKINFGPIEGQGITYDCCKYTGKKI